MCILSLLSKLYHIPEEISIPTERSDTMPKLIVTSRYVKKRCSKKIAEQCELHCNQWRLCACKRNSGNEPQKMKKSLFHRFSTLWETNKIGLQILWNSFMRKSVTIPLKMPTHFQNSRLISSVVDSNPFLTEKHLRFHTKNFRP